MIRGRSTAGFTLIEALASLAVFAAVSLLLLEGSRLLRLDVLRLQPQDDGRALASAQSWLRGRLQRAFPYAKPYTGQLQVDFDGQPQGLTFVAPPPDADAPDALQHYALALKPAGDLEVSISNDLALDPQQSARRQRILDQVAGMQLAYFGAAPPDNQPRWRERWEQQPALPTLVRIRVSFPKGDRRVWPDLIVDPTARLDSQCIIAPATGLCRRGS
jgi:general secretion pathway protein J